MKYYIFIDTGLFALVTDDKNKKIYNNFYNSLITDLSKLKENNQFIIVFPSYSLLEAIGLGNFLSQKPKFTIINKTNLNLNYNEVEKKINKTLNLAKKHLLSHPKLEKENLLKEIQNFKKHHQNKMTKDLIQQTIIRYENEIKKNFKNFQENLTKDLAWELTIQIMFINPQEISKKNHPQLNDYMKKVITKLTLKVIKLNENKIVPNFYRLSDAVSKFASYMGYINKNDKISQTYHLANFLENNKDLCDSIYIDIAILGIKYKKTKPCYIFTADKKDVIRFRLAHALNVIETLNPMLNTPLKLTPGTIFTVNPKTGNFENKINVKSVIKNKEVEILHKENSFNRNEVLF